MDSASNQREAAEFSARDSDQRALALRAAMVRLREIAAGAGIDTALNGRIKSPASIAAKMGRVGITPSQMRDIIGIRLVVAWTSNCYRLAMLIADEFDVLADDNDDYIASPKSNGYRAIHTTILGLFDFPIEVQLRTTWMNDAAERGQARRPFDT